MTANVLYRDNLVKITGTKLESDGSPNAGCLVTLVYPETKQTWRAVTDKKGYFEISLTDPKAGYYEVRYHGSGNVNRRFQPQGDWEIIEIKDFAKLYDNTPPDETKAGDLANFLNE
ncbi:MAG TPA: carboxypeptidase-like regulatory domain-containing protein [Ignavibacteriales bacterium]|nr:carboxypeptidase-like regulatory domain-containing protein [Ignavibacteriales bacterium]